MIILIMKSVVISTIDDHDDSGDNNAITDGGVALPKFLLTIVMKFSNFRSLRISRNS